MMCENNDKTASRAVAEERTILLKIVKSRPCSEDSVLRKAFDEASIASLDRADGWAK